MTSCGPGVQPRACRNWPRKWGLKWWGTYLFIASREPEQKVVKDYAALMTLKGVDDVTKSIDIVPELL